MWEAVAEEKRAPVRLRVADVIPPGYGRVEFVMSVYKEAMDIFIRAKAAGQPVEWMDAILRSFTSHAPFGEDPAFSLRRAEIILSKHGKIFLEEPASDPASITAYLINYGGASWSDQAMYYSKYALSALFTVVPPGVVFSILGVVLTVALNEIVIPNTPLAVASTNPSDGSSALSSSGNLAASGAPVESGGSYLDGTYTVISDVVCYVWSFFF